MLALLARHRPGYCLIGAHLTILCPTISQRIGHHVLSQIVACPVIRHGELGTEFCLFGPAFGLALIVGCSAVLRTAKDPARIRRLKFGAAVLAVFEHSILAPQVFLDHVHCFRSPFAYSHAIAAPLKFAQSCPLFVGKAPMLGTLHLDV